MNKKRITLLLALGIMILFLMIYLFVGEKQWKEKFPLDVNIQNVMKESTVGLVKLSRKELFPVTAYVQGGKENEGEFLVTLAKRIIAIHLFPIQQYSFDYWKENENYCAKYDDQVPEYFKEADDAPVKEEKKKTQIVKNKNKNGEQYSLKQLSDREFLLKNFYIVDETTTMTKSDLKGKEMVQKDLSVSITGEKPLILIYHTHGSETYEKGGSVVAVGEKLKKILEEQYGITVIHDSSIYDMVDGKLDRNRAYNYAGDSVQRKLKKNPSIKIVIDLHRDSVDESIRLVSNIDKKKTAQIMFFNGVSRLSNGEDIGYLYNPNKQDNLAFSLQLQLLAAKYYPELTRKIYIKGYRYNLQVVKRAMLVEVGAQNNTLKEAQNAMFPLAEILYRLMTGEKTFTNNKK